MYFSSYKFFSGGSTIKSEAKGIQKEAQFLVLKAITKQPR
jgi:hypothetical protein